MLHKLTMHVCTCIMGHHACLLTPCSSPTLTLTMCPQAFRCRRSKSPAAASMTVQASGSSLSRA